MAAPSKGVWGQFVKFDAVATRKVVRLVIEAPIEKADEILRQLGGFPDPANSQCVAVVPMAVAPENTLKGGKLAQKAGIICNEGAFKQFCEERYDNPPLETIYSICNVTSRAHLDHNDESGRAFNELKSEYNAWLKVG